jgi:hypothetical protein
MIKQAIAKTYEPTEKERVVMDLFLARQKGKPPSPGLKVTDKKGATQIGPDHEDPSLGTSLMMEAIGTADIAFFEGFVAELANATNHRSNVSERELNFMLAVVKSIEPKDEVEAMIAAQMAAVHMATMTFTRRLTHVETIPQQDSATSAFNKLARTYAVQMDALKRYRSSGEQTIKVQHVTVNDGGQAIVGNVEQGGGGTARKIG